MSLSTCQRCTKQFNPQSNTSKSCIFHRCTYVERESFTKSWDCCGKTCYYARECGIDKHITYDESWKKDDDFYTQHRPEIFINIQTLRTCQRCHTQFDINSNTTSSCEFHRCTYSGNIWDCCAGKGINAKTCVMSKHITYDEKWIKWYDFFIKPIVPIAKSTIGQTGSWIYHPQKGYIMVKWDTTNECKAIPIKYNDKGESTQQYSQIFDMDYVVQICEKYNNKKLSHAIHEVMRKLPFTKVTSHLIAKMIVIDLMKTNKLYGINLINDLDEMENTNQVTENLISTFSSSTLDKLAEIL